MRSLACILVGLLLVVTVINGLNFKKSVATKSDATVQKRGELDCNITVEVECVEEGGACESDCEFDEEDVLVCNLCSMFGECPESGECPETYVGLECDDDEDCQGELNSDPAVCDEGECVALDDYKGSNDPCESSEECFSELICGESEVCVGAAFNESCENSRECAFGLFCSEDTSRCEELLGMGDACESNDECGFVEGVIMECNSKAEPHAICTPWFSLGEDDPCDSPLLCEEGLTCADSTCVEYDEGGESCDPMADDECAEGASCACANNEDEIEYKCTPNGIDFSECEGKLKSAVGCLEENECGDTSVYWEGTCANEECGDLIEEALNCIVRQEFGMFPQDAGECVFGDDIFEDDGDDDSDTQVPVDSSSCLSSFLF